MKIESDILKTAAVVAILAGVYGGLVFWPTQKQNKVMADSVQTKQAELSAMTKPDLDPLKDEISALKAELAERVIELPKGDLDDRVLQHVSETLIAQGVTLYETSYREPKFYKRFAVAPIDVSFSTSFPQAFEIIHRIETAGPPVRIERIELSGRPDETNGYVAVTMQLSTFFIPTKQGGQR